MKKVFLLIGSIFLFLACIIIVAYWDREKEYDFYDVLNYYMIDEIENFEGTYSEYSISKHFYSGDLGTSRLAFLIAENFIQLSTENNSNSKCKYFFFSKEYTDFRTWNICFVEKNLLRNGGYPCVEIDQKTGFILRIYLAGKLDQKEELKFVPVLQNINWLEKNELFFQEKNRSINFLGCFKSNLSYYSSHPKPYPVRNVDKEKLMVLNGVDLLRLYFRDQCFMPGKLKDIRLLSQQLNDRKIHILLARTNENFLYLNAIMDSETGNILALSM